MLRTVATILTLVLAVVLPAALACSEYKITQKKLESCADNSAIEVKDFTVELVERGSRCVAVVKGRVSIKQDVQEIKAHYTVRKGLAKFEGDIDGCQEMESMPGEVAMMFDLFGIPKECPIKANELNFMEGKEVDITKHASYLSMATGNIKGKIDVDHGNGVRSCIDVVLNIKKQRT